VAASDESGDDGAMELELEIESGDESSPVEPTGHQNPSLEPLTISNEAPNALDSLTLSMSAKGGAGAHRLIGMMKRAASNPNPVTGIQIHQDSRLPAAIDITQSGDSLPATQPLAPSEPSRPADDLYDTDDDADGVDLYRKMQSEKLRMEEEEARQAQQRLRVQQRMLKKSKKTERRQAELRMELDELQEAEQLRENSRKRRSGRTAEDLDDRSEPDDSDAIVSDVDADDQEQPDEDVRDANSVHRDSDEDETFGELAFQRELSRSDFKHHSLSQSAFLDHDSKSQQILELVKKSSRVAVDSTFDSEAAMDIDPADFDRVRSFFASPPESLTVDFPWHPVPTRCRHPRCCI
jgi:hypothetical protein